MTLCFIYYKHYLIAEKMKINNDALCHKRIEPFTVVLKKRRKNTNNKFYNLKANCFLKC